MGRNHQQQKRNNTRGPCRFHTKWLWLVLAAAVMGAFGTLEAVTLAQDSVYREAMRPFPELVIACAACNFVGVVGCVVLIARAALCKAADPSAELRGLRSTGFCSYVYTLSSVSLHSIVATLKIEKVKELWPLLWKCLAIESGVFVAEIVFLAVFIAAGCITACQQQHSGKYNDDVVEERL